ncbi:organic cation/carnitine transporter 2-like [Engraulis encrasicolus]|uniref:organic cation/carnitine transporter 2-like n=1 Tax=Engraulis encrasicolus TaxID=184585 RepID=UPI002FD02C86
MKDYEETITFLGEWGHFQRMVFIVLSLGYIPIGFMSLAMVFLGDTPPHHCRVPSLNSSYGGLGYNLSIPTEELKGETILSRCRRYTEQEESGSTYSNDTEGCVDGWVFSKEMYVSTIVTEWNLVCDDAWKAPFTITVFFTAVLVGSFCAGLLADRFGRKITFVSTKAMETLIYLLLAFSNSWEIFCVIYFLLGVMKTASCCACFVLGSELLSKSARESFGILGVSLCFATGYAFLPLYAYFIRDWRTLQIGLSLFGFLYMPLCWFIPESPRWLITQGRLQEAEAIIRAAAKRNGITPPEEIFQLEHSADTEETDQESKGRDKYTFFDLLRTANLRNITLICIMMCFTKSLMYYGLSLNTSNLDGDPYRNCLISAGTEFLGYTLVWFEARYAPRRVILPFAFLLGGSLLLLIQFVPTELSWLTVTLAMTGRLVVIGVYTFIDVYSTELFPTVVRNMGLGVCTMASGIASAVSPYIAHIGTYNKTLPFILMGTISLFSGGLSLLLPETKGEELKQLITQVKPIRCLVMAPSPEADSLSYSTDRGRETGVGYPSATSAGDIKKNMLDEEVYFTRISC